MARYFLYFAVVLVAVQVSSAAFGDFFGNPSQSLGIPTSCSDVIKKIRTALETFAEKGKECCHKFQEASQKQCDSMCAQFRKKLADLEEQHKANKQNFQDCKAKSQPEIDQILAEVKQIPKTCAQQEEKKAEAAIKPFQDLEKEVEAFEKTKPGFSENLKKLPGFLAEVAKDTAKLKAFELQAPVELVACLATKAKDETKKVAKVAQDIANCLHEQKQQQQQQQPEEPQQQPEEEPQQQQEEEPQQQ